MELKQTRFAEMQINYLKNIIYKMQLADMGEVDDATYKLAVAKLAKLYEEKGEN